VRRLLTDGLRFGLVGLAATATHLAVALSVLHFGTAPVVANTLGFLVAVNVSIFGHQFFSFPGRVPLLHGALRFVPAAVVGFLLNTVVLVGLVAAHVVPAWASIVIALAVIPLATFGYARLFAYRTRVDRDVVGSDRVRARQSPRKEGARGDGSE